jgi:hypothetical protein
MIISTRPHQQFSRATAGRDQSRHRDRRSIPRAVRRQHGPGRTTGRGRRPPAPEASASVAASCASTTVVSLRWSTPAFASVKGVVHQTEAKPILKQEIRDGMTRGSITPRSRSGWLRHRPSGHTFNRSCGHDLPTRL